MHTLRRDVLAGDRDPTDVVVFHNGPPQRRDVFVGLIAQSPDVQEREKQYQAAAASVTSEYEISPLIMLAWTPQPTDLPYFGLLLFDTT